MMFQGTRTKSRENATPLGDKESKPTLSGTAAYLLTNRGERRRRQTDKIKDCQSCKGFRYHLECCFSNWPVSVASESCTVSLRKFLCFVLIIILKKKNQLYSGSSSWLPYNQGLTRKLSGCVHSCSGATYHLK